MPSSGNASTWAEYRSRGKFSRRECERIDVLYRRLDRLGKRIQESVELEDLQRPGLSFDRKEMEALDWALEIVLDSVPDSPEPESEGTLK